MTEQTAQLIEQVSGDLSSLPEEDLALVAAFVTYLKQRQAAPPPRLSAATIRAEAQRRAAAMGDLPRAELVSRFQHLAEEVRRQAIVQGTAVEEDWEGD
ncbi:MAG: hypothetical protein ACLFVO_03325 [Chloroflexaceae bacterium]